MKKIVLPILSALMLSCGDEPLPKPKAFLRLDYPKAVYEKAKVQLPFTFEKNKMAEPVSPVKVIGDTKGVDIKYPSIKSTIYLTYKQVKNNNLDNLLRDAQNLTQKHTMKADEIKPKEYLNEKHNVYGMFYEVGGDAASQSQFYVTDSTKHFISGSLYFYAKPNYDSIYPAAEYLKKDIKRIMESVRWQEN